MTSVNDPLPLHPHLLFLFEKMMELLEVEQKMGGREGRTKTHSISLQLNATQCATQTILTKTKLAGNVCTQHLL